MGDCTKEIACLRQTDLSVNIYEQAGVEENHGTRAYQYINDQAAKQTEIYFGTRKVFLYLTRTLYG
jgi:hypothetical protein